MPKIDSFKCECMEGFLEKRVSGENQCQRKPVQDDGCATAN